MTEVLRSDGTIGGPSWLVTRYEKDTFVGTAMVTFIVGDLMFAAGAIMHWTTSMQIGFLLILLAATLYALHRSIGRSYHRTRMRTIRTDDREYIDDFNQYNSNTTPNQGVQAVRHAWVGGLKLLATYMADLRSLQHEEARFTASFQEAQATILHTYQELFSDFLHYETVFNMTRGRDMKKNPALLKATDVMIQEVLACSELTEQASKLFVESRFPNKHEPVLTEEINKVVKRLDALSELDPTPALVAGPASEAEVPSTKLKPKKSKDQRALRKLAVNESTQKLVDELLIELQGAVVPDPVESEKIIERVQADMYSLKETNKPRTRFCWDCKDCIKTARLQEDCEATHDCLTCEAAWEESDLKCISCNLSHETKEYYAQWEQGAFLAHEPILLTPRSLKVRAQNEADSVGRLQLRDESN